MNPPMSRRVEGNNSSVQKIVFFFFYTFLNILTRRVPTPLFIRYECTDIQIVSVENNRHIRIYIYEIKRS